MNIDGKAWRTIWLEPDGRAVGVYSGIGTFCSGQVVAAEAAIAEWRGVAIVDTVPDAEAPPQFTPKQGQYLAFIHNYILLHGEAPAEAEMQRFFKVTPPTVHSMVLRLAEYGLIARTPGQARSIRMLVPAQYLPALVDP